jgi:hypothetical protein
MPATIIEITAAIPTNIPNILTIVVKTPFEPNKGFLSGLLGSTAFLSWQAVELEAEEVQISLKTSSASTFPAPPIKIIPKTKIIKKLLITAGHGLRI